MTKKTKLLIYLGVCVFWLVIEVSLGAFAVAMVLVKQRPEFILYVVICAVTASIDWRMANDAYKLLDDC